MFRKNRPILPIFKAESALSSRLSLRLYPELQRIDPNSSLDQRDLSDRQLQMPKPPKQAQQDRTVILCLPKHSIDRT